MKRKSMEISQAIEDLGYEECEGDLKLLISKEFRNFRYKNTLSVGGRLSYATLLAAFIEFKAIHNSNNNPTLYNKICLELD
jgi:hypothetical protein